MDVDFWFVSEGEIDGLPALIRAREMLPEAVRPASHTKLLTIVWDYEGDSVSGMPSSEEAQEMGDFEELIVPALEKDDVSALFAVVTHDGRRYWRFYCRDKESTQLSITNALGPEGDLPIDLEMDDDPEWSALSQILEDVEQAH